MDKYLTVQDFPNSSLPEAIIQSSVSSVPPMFAIMYLVFWLAIAGASYFAILKTTGRKRFWHTALASSFIMFLVSLVTILMNTATTTYLDPYWVAFYILMTLLTWLGLSNYK